jgi:SAM-dependent methyltransferase
MTASHASFVGSIPAVYDEALGPMFFVPYAIDLAARVRVAPGAAVLEIAAGTGQVTKRLLANLPADARLVATDLNDAMIDLAKTKVPADARVSWKTADAGSLPFPDKSFDAAVCQFGWMFFPDKIGALREARRVLKPGAPLILNIWGSLDENPIGRIAHSTIVSFFPADPPLFYLTPFGVTQTDIDRMFAEAGFTSVACDTIDRIGESASAELAAKGLIFGSPVLNGIIERGSVDPERVRQAIAARLAEDGGASPMRLPMRARVFTAIA